jgi:hypothetical protein
MSTLPPTKAPCPLCGNQDTSFRTGDPFSFFQCDRCGQFGMTVELRVDEEFQGKNHPYLSAATRKEFEMSGRPLALMTTNWRKLEDVQRSIRISEKRTDLLRLIADRSGGPGHVSKIRATFDFSLIAAEHAGELQFYLNDFEERKLLRCLSQTNDGNSYQLTVAGWQELEPTKLPGGMPGHCFIAMSFDPSLDDAYNLGIEPAIREDCNFIPHRMDKIEHNEKICDKIIADIRACEFMVADFTKDRGGVYFEAGFAMALDRKVIWTCREEHDTLHFDTRQYNHIHWSSPEDLRAKLAVRIRATIPGAKAG